VGAFVCIFVHVYICIIFTVQNANQDVLTHFYHFTHKYFATIPADIWQLFAQINSTSLLHHIATHCHTLQHTTIVCNTRQDTATHCRTLQHIATHHSTLHHTTRLCNTLQHIATHYSSLQHTSRHCNTLQDRLK